jgi:hypothetical protein
LIVDQFSVGSRRIVRPRSFLPKSSQIPCLEIFVISTSKVSMPSISDFIFVFLDQSIRSLKVSASQTVIVRQFDSRFNPELRLAATAVNMTCILGSSREKKKKRKPSSRKIVGLITRSRLNESRHNNSEKQEMAPAGSCGTNRNALPDGRATAPLRKHARHREL